MRALHRKSRQLVVGYFLLLCFPPWLRGVKTVASKKVVCITNWLRCIGQHVSTCCLNKAQCNRPSVRVAGITGSQIGVIPGVEVNVR